MRKRKDRDIFLFDVYHPGEAAAGYTPFSCSAKITVENFPYIDEEENFSEHMRQALADYFETKQVVLCKHQQTK